MYSLHALMNDMAYEMPGSELDFLAQLIKDSGINAPDEASTRPTRWPTASTLLRLG
jgi:hypothetical protein